MSNWAEKPVSLKITNKIVDLSGRRQVHEESFVIAHCILSEFHLALEASFLPLYSDVLGICYDCDSEVWSAQGQLAGHQTHFALSSISQGRL